MAKAALHFQSLFAQSHPKKKYSSVLSLLCKSLTALKTSYTFYLFKKYCYRNHMRMISGYFVSSAVKLACILYHFVSAAFQILSHNGFHFTLHLLLVFIVCVTFVEV